MDLLPNLHRLFILHACIHVGPQKCPETAPYCMHTWVRAANFPARPPPLPLSPHVGRPGCHHEDCGGGSKLILLCAIPQSLPVFRLASRSAGIPVSSAKGKRELQNRFALRARMSRCLLVWADEARPTKIPASSPAELAVCCNQTASHLERATRFEP